MKVFNSIHKKKRIWIWRNLLCIDTPQNEQWQRLSSSCKQGSIPTICENLVWLNITPKNLSRSPALLGVHSASVHSEVIAPLQWLLSVDKRKALPETYLLSTGQFLCVVLPMIDCKRTHKNDLQQFTCTFLRLEERALDLLCTSFLWQSYNYVGVRGTHGTLTRKLTNISTVRSWDGCIILQVLNLSLYLGENL